jgi:hypothetical protein
MALTDAPAPQEPVKPRRSFLEKLLPFTTIGVIIALAYAGWVFYSRHQSEVEAARAAAAKEQAARQRTVDAVFGHGEIVFNMFSADKGLLHRGERTNLCYGVENAASVKIDPPVGEETKPMYRHCIEIAPTKTTTYTITADDGKGHTKSESLLIQVR